jgi:ubiquinone biosynthesis protein
LDDQLPKKGGAPEAPPLPPVKLIWDKSQKNGNGWRYIGVAAIAGALGAIVMRFWG